jgi:predicted RNA-binding Zn ribbon-like protein
MSTSPALFLAGHPAVDFVNTRYAPDGGVVETIGDGRAFLDWMVAAELVDAAAADRLRRRFGARALDVAAAEAREVREWAREWIARWHAAPAADYREEIAFLNGLLARVPQIAELFTSGRALHLRQRPRVETANALLGLVALELARLVTLEQAGLVKPCAGSACTLWFVDHTKAHRRRFCSAAVCGNRAKVAAFRKRQRE